MEFKKIEISYIGDNSFIEMLKWIANTGAAGHSFSIVVDPKDEDYSKEFGFDGDGSDRMAYIKVDGKLEYGKEQNDIQKSIDDQFNALKEHIVKYFEH